jgi:signal peptidase II
MGEVLQALKAQLRAPITRLGIWCLGIGIVIVVLDQATKAWMLYGLRLENGPVKILPFFSFTLVHNTGMSFGLLGGSAFGRWFLTLFQLSAGIGLGFLTLKQVQRLPAFALCLIAGGAVGNVIDRIRFGFVVDFLDFSGTHIFPWVFNVADSAICIGVALLAWYFLKSEESAKAPAAGPDA